MSNRKPGQYILSDITIINYEGKSVDIKSALIDFDVQSDLFNTCLHGTLKIQDLGDFQQNLPLIGEEILQIKFKTNPDSEPTVMNFYIYSLVDKTKRGEDGFEYKLNFCSIEMLQNRALNLSESFYNLNASDIVKRCFSRISSKAIDIEDTVNNINYISPSVSPFEIINYMTTRSISKSFPNTGTYVFYEDLKGFNYRTIDSMISDESKAEYSFNHKNQINTNMDNEFYTVNSWEIVQHYDILDGLNKGGYGATTRVLDPFTRSYGVKTFNIFSDDDYNKVEHINKDKNSSLHSSKFNFTQAPNNFIKFRMVDDIVDKENIMGSRYTQINRITNSYKLVLEIPGNTDITTGDTITLNYLNHSSDTNINDLYLQGKYLIIAIRHIFNTSEYHMILEVIKDSYHNNHEEVDRMSFITS